MGLLWYNISGGDKYGIYEAIVEIARRMARTEAGEGTVIDIEWMGEEEL
jgi:hypothetical protein